MNSNRALFFSSIESNAFGVGGRRGVCMPRARLSLIDGVSTHRDEMPAARRAPRIIGVWLCARGVCAGTLAHQSKMPPPPAAGTPGAGGAGHDLEPVVVFVIRSIRALKSFHHIPPSSHRKPAQGSSQKERERKMDGGGGDMDMGGMSMSMTFSPFSTYKLKGACVGMRWLLVGPQPPESPPSPSLIP